MVFSSIVFIFKFLPLFFLLYGVCPFKWKNACLFIGSLIFYFYGVRDNPFYFLLFLFSIVINYMLGGLIGRRKSKKMLAMRNQIRKRRISFSMIEEGLREFTIGLGMKVLIANQVGGL